ncbi:MAG: hypothetical protein N3E52_03265 [Candidatus Bathyarchaeota archaeon]|nr:hypothetical protein [Candidatus Bathyarchaeota archaeon]
MKEKIVTIALIILMSTVLSLMPFPRVHGQGGVNIYLLSPQGQGTVGQNVNLQGTIDTNNGKYEIWFGDKVVASNNSKGYNVNANFTIPELPSGTYTIKLRDIARNVNATQNFNIIPAYYIKAIEPPAPVLLQQGNFAMLNVTVTGGQPNTQYYANITVKLPAPLNTSYSKVITLLSTSQGTAQAQLTYPATDFQPSGSLTNYTGVYQVYFNETQKLASSQFFVGFISSSEYHREQVITMRAIGYQPNETATITITYTKTGFKVYTAETVASSEGIVSVIWTVPSDALLGEYNVTITSHNKSKLLFDSQLFTIPGYWVKFKTLNLASEPVPKITVEATDQLSAETINSTSNNEGIAALKLEKGNYTIIAYWNDVDVGKINVIVTGEGSFNLPCELTNLKITVRDKDGNLLPFVNIDITYQYTTKERQTKTGMVSGQTGLSGTFTLNSTLTGISYTINASLYGVVFNYNNGTFSILTAQPASEVLIVCPAQTISLKVLDNSRNAIPNARIEMVEVTTGLFYGIDVDSAGVATLEATIGKYKTRVYTDNILLYETFIEVFRDTQSEIYCYLYNIQVKIMIIDYFGQPISNVNVLLKNIGGESWSAVTQADGTATFSNIIGGSMQIIIYHGSLESAYEVATVQINEPTTVQIRMTRYVILGAFIVEIAILATFSLVIAAIGLFIAIEFYKKQKNSIKCNA